MKPKFSLEEYLIEVAKRLRQHEAERARGNLTQLEELEHTTDATLLRKWGWLSTIIGAVFSFLLLPFVLGIIQPFVPEMLSLFLWAVVKVSMGMSLLMLAVSIYFTIGYQSEK